MGTRRLPVTTVPMTSVYNHFRLTIVVNASPKSMSRFYCYHIEQRGVGDLSTRSSSAMEAGPCVWLLQSSTLSTGKAQGLLTTVMNQTQQERCSKERGPASQPTSQHSWLKSLPLSVYERVSLLGAGEEEAGMVSTLCSQGTMSAQ